MNQKSPKVNKSKSSNIYMASNKNKKQCKSNAEIKPVQNSKKRGFYVERTSNASISKAELKKKPIPRPEKTKFLTSVLAILSKSTTSTQFPELANEKTRVIKKTKRKTKIAKKNSNETPQKTTVLNSKNSENTLSVTQSQNNAEIMNLVEYQSSVSKIYISSTRSNEMGFRSLDYNPEPATAVSKETDKDKKQLYNFFVELLQYSFKVYNVETYEDKPTISSAKSSKVSLEIDENVANKLFSKKPAQSPLNWMNSIRKNFDSEDLAMKDNIFEPPLDIDDIELLQDATPTFCKPKSVFFDFKMPKRKTKSAPKVSSKTFITSKLTYNKKNRKKVLLNMLKDELKKKNNQYEEPKNFFQALKQIGKNKLLCQKSIRFENNKLKPVENMHDCMYKRKKLLSINTKPKVNKKFNAYNDNSVLPSNAAVAVNKKFNEEKPAAMTESKLSLQVYGYDFGKPRIVPEDLTQNVSRHTISDLSLSTGSSYLSESGQKFVPEW